jgi:hypothetical protein
MQSFLEQFAEYAGAERFAKFVSALRAQPRIERRLMYWQEQLLAEFATAKELHAPQSLAEVVALFAAPPRSVDLGESNARIPLLRSSVFREFRSIAQNASGGSHVTLFEIEIDPHPGSISCNLTDGAGPHESAEVAVQLLDALEQGVTRFVADHQTRGNWFDGFSVQVLSYVHNGAEFKASKHQAAIAFVLHDLLSETLTGRRVPAKMVGIPL